MATATDLDKPRYSGSVSFPDDMPFEKIERAVVLIVGKSPNAKATILSFDGAGRKGKGIQVDVMRKATITEDGRRLVINGESLRMVHELKVNDPSLEVVLERNAKCRDCAGA